MKSAILPENPYVLRELGIPGVGSLSPRSTDSDFGSGAIWTNAGRLTLSFAPDGTQISRYTNTLYETFGHMLSPIELERTIVDAFQTWAVESSVNVGMVDDSGDPFGAAGRTQIEPGFGDIRIGAVPMAGDVFAIAVPHNEFLSGTWAGEILFNSNAEFKNVEQVFAVAIHEAGHVLGLEHSDQPDSVMHPTALNSVLTVEDIDQIRQKYEVRTLDQYDWDGERNDTFDDAVEIRNNSSVNGIIPLVAFGDLESASDVDFFSIKPNSGYTGSITFRLLNESISAFDGKLTIFDEQGNPLASQQGAGSLGSDFSITINNVNPGDDYFARIETASDSRYSFGSYALITTIDNNLIQGSELIPAFVRSNYYFLKQNDVQTLFLDFESGVINDDLHTNDSLATATLMPTLPGDLDEERFRIQASIADNIDIDFYQVAASGNVMTIDLTALATPGLIANVDVFDANGVAIVGDTHVNGNGELLMQFSDLAIGDDYFVAVSADQPLLAFNTGNYQLDLDFVRPKIELDTLGAGRIDNTNRERAHSLYVARTQMFHLSLSASESPASPNATLWMTVLDEDANVVHRIATRPGATRTAQSVILRPGSYSVRVNATVPIPLARRQRIRQIPQIDYTINGIGVSDPTGPEVIDPSEDPFRPCDKQSTDFCYPNNRRSSDPFIFVEPDEVITPPVNPPRWTHANYWYWSDDWLG